MKPSDRILGALEENKKHVDFRFDQVYERLNKIESKLDKHDKRHWKSVGAKTLATGFLILLIDIFFH